MAEILVTWISLLPNIAVSISPKNSISVWPYFLFPLEAFSAWNELVRGDCRLGLSLSFQCHQLPSFLSVLFLHPLKFFLHFIPFLFTKHSTFSFLPALVFTHTLTIMSSSYFLSLRLSVASRFLLKLYLSSFPRVCGAFKTSCWQVITVTA